MFKNLFSKSVSLAVVFSLASLSASATIVEFETNHGNFQVNLFDTTTPKTVENFLSYVESGHYTDTVIHRVVPDFIVQGGGFSFEGDWPLTKNQTNASVVNEPVYSNVKGTIAMAKVGGNVNSATNQWFFNLVNNSSNLDSQNGGFTAFGQVVGDGMDTINAIATINRCNEIPMTDFTTAECTAASTPGIENFVVVYSVTIVDSSTVTDADLTPPKSTYNPEEPQQPNSGGGTFAWLTLLALVVSSRRLFSK